MHMYLMYMYIYLISSRTYHTQEDSSSSVASPTPSATAGATTAAAGAMHGRRRHSDSRPAAGYHTVAHCQSLTAKSRPSIPQFPPHCCQCAQQHCHATLRVARQHSHNALGTINFG